MIVALLGFCRSLLLHQPLNPDQEGYQLKSIIVSIIITYYLEVEAQALPPKAGRFSDLLR